MNKVSMMIIGCGAIAEKAHLPAIRRIPQADVSGLVDKNIQRAQELKQKFSIPHAKVFENHNEALEAIDPDAVLILTPPSTHIQIIEDLAPTKKHIFCEKPIATNLQDAVRIGQLITKPTKFMIGFQYRFLPQIRRMHKMMKSGEIGTPISMISIFSQDISQWPSVSEYQYKKELGGGALFDSGTHYADLMKWFLGDIKSVESKIARFGETTYDIEDFATIQLEFDNGSTGTTYIIWCGPMLTEFFVIGNKGILKTNDLTNIIQAYKKEFWILPPVEIRTKQSISPYHSELNHFIECIQKDKEVEVGVKEGIEALRIILAAYESADVGKKIQLSKP